MIWGRGDCRQGELTEGFGRGCFWDYDGGIDGTATDWKSPTTSRGASSPTPAIPQEATSMLVTQPQVLAKRRPDGPELTEYGIELTLRSMKIGERGQVTIPKEIRERFGLRPNTEVEFRIESGSIILKKAPKKLNLEKWKGHSSASFRDLGYSSVDDYIEDIRGRQVCRLAFQPGQVSTNLTGFPK